MKKIRLFFAATSLLLASCGGGGSGDSTSRPSSNLQTSVATPTYAAASQELIFFNEFNKFRADIGMGLLAQNTRLDTSAQNHLNYMRTNTDVNFTAIDSVTGRLFYHIEDSARVNFTGVTEFERAQFTQYGPTYVGEMVAFGLGSGSLTALSNLVGTVYHRSGLFFQGPRDFGIAIGTDANQTIVIEVGYQSQPQTNASNFFGVYPKENQTGVPLVAYIEAPNPFPEITYAEYATKTGYPINVISEASTTLTVTSFTVTEAGQTNSIDARLTTKATDPNNQLLANTAFLIPRTPFKSNTTYNVNLAGSVNGVAKNKAWSFVTGS